MKPFKKIKKRLEARRQSRDMLLETLRRQPGVNAATIDRAYKRPGSNKK